MNVILTLFVIIGTISNSASARWVTIDDFSPSELANLTPEKEHELMLQKLAKKEDRFLVSAFNYEILANSIGNSFFQFQQDKNTVRENNAIIKAMFEGAKKLLIQERIWRLLWTISVNGAEYVHTFNSFSVAFSLVCADIDFSLKNETLYTTFRDEFKKQSYLPPNKIYHYGVSKSFKDEIKAVEELLNEPKMKHTAAHMAWVWIMDSYNSTIKDIKNSVLSLAKVPDKLDEVQKIYETSIDEVTPLIKHMDISVFAPDAKRLYFDYLQFNLTKRMWNKIMEEIPDWKDYFECDTSDDDDGRATSPAELKTGKGRCGTAKVGKDSIFISAWPVTNELRPLELQNLTLQKEHEIFLKILLSKNFRLVNAFIYLEFLAKNIGNDFFGFIKDEKSNIRSIAIVKAAFECISNLQLQERGINTIASGIKSAGSRFTSSGDINLEFIEFCSNIDDMLRNETFYTSKRDDYMKQNVSLPIKTYQYSFGKPTEDQRKIIAELFNHNLIKKFMLHTLWMDMKSPKTHKSEEARTKFTIMKLIKVPSKTEAVQKIYEQSIDETIPLIRNFTYTEILQNINAPTIVVATYELAEIFHYAGLITKRIIEKINKHPDLVPIFNAIGRHYDTSMVEQTTDEVVIKSGHRIYR